MKKIAFIIPWCGKLPDYFPLWVESCRWNPSIDFLVFTDNHANIDCPENVKWFFMSFTEMKELFQKSFEFTISINAPYKFCDFRPAYGEIFSDYLVGYDYWGHCDIDLIWGDIRKFITDEILTKYKRIFSRGHCSLYENSQFVNAWYRLLDRKECQNWMDVFQSDQSCCFDEWAGHCGGGMSQIIESNGYDIFDEIYSADINVTKGYFRINRKKIKDKHIYFEFDKGKLYYISNNQKNEVLCCHFQKRKLKIAHEIQKNKFYLLAPNKIVSSVKNVKRNVVQECFFEFNYWLQKIRKKIIK